MSEPKAALLSQPSVQTLVSADKDSLTSFEFQKVARAHHFSSDDEKWWLSSAVVSAEEEDITEQPAGGELVVEEEVVADDLPELSGDVQLPVSGDDLSDEAFDLHEDLPSLGLDEPDVLDDPESDPESARLESYDAGYQDGLAAGFQEHKENELEQAKLAGYKTGLESGKAKGLEQGLKEGRAALSQQQQVLDGVLEQAQPWAKSIYPDQVAMMVRLIEGIACQAVLVEQLYSSGAVSRAVLAGLEQMAETAGSVKIELHPDDANEIRELAKKEQVNWDLLPDTSITKGGCRISSDDVIVDSTIERRLVGALEAVKESFLLSLGDDDGANKYIAPAPEVDLEPLQQSRTNTGRRSKTSPEPAMTSSAVKAAEPERVSDIASEITQPRSTQADAMQSAAITAEPGANPAGDLGAWDSLGQ